IEHSDSSTGSGYRVVSARVADLLPGPVRMAGDIAIEYGCLGRDNRGWNHLPPALFSRILVYGRNGEVLDHRDHRGAWHGALAGQPWCAGAHDIRRVVCGALR